MSSHARAAFCVCSLTVWGCDAPRELDGELPDSHATVTQAVAITRHIPLRFIHLLGCRPEPGCLHRSNVDDLVQSIEHANGVFDAAGIEFWMMSNEYFEAPHFTDLNVNDPVKWVEVVQELQRIYPNIPTDAYPDGDEKTPVKWLNAAAAYYGTVDMAHVYVPSAGPSDTAEVPEKGRSLRVLDLSFESVPLGYPLFLAHELGHYLGLAHTFEHPTAINPETGQEWTFADRWDLVYCVINLQPYFFGSKAHAQVTCPPQLGLEFELIDQQVPGTCQGTPGTLDPLSCTLQVGLDTYTYVAGDWELKGLAYSDPDVLFHSPPTTWKYQANVMGYWGTPPGEWEIDLATPPMISSSQIFQLSKYLEFDNEFTHDGWPRSDGEHPFGSHGFWKYSLRSGLGQSVRPFAWWANTFDASVHFSFDAKVDMNPAMEVWTPVSGDFDGDAHDDIFFYAHNEPVSLFYWGSPNRTLTEAWQAVQPAGEFAPFSGDFDGDGDSDLLLFGAGSAQDYLLWSDGAGGFVQKELVVDGGDRQLVIGNFDGQFGDDIFWYSPTQGDVNRWYSDGSQDFMVLDGYPADPGGPFQAVAGNFNGSSGDDILWYTATPGGDRIWYSLGSQTFLKLDAMNVEGDFVPTPGDFDGDGKTDIFWDASASTDDALWKGATASTQFERRVTSGVFGTYAPASGDFDGDGFDDIYWYR